MAYPQLTTKFAINFSVQVKIFENVVFSNVTQIPNNILEENSSSPKISRKLPKVS